jgi:hypothetical protein
MRDSTIHKKKVMLRQASLSQFGADQLSQLNESRAILLEEKQK